MSDKETLLIWQSVAGWTDETENNLIDLNLEVHLGRKPIILELLSFKVFTVKVQGAEIPFQLGDILIQGPEKTVQILL